MENAERLKESAPQHGNAMSQFALKIESLGKRYQIRAHGTERYLTLRDHFAGAFNRRSSRRPNADFWALKDVSFDLPKGEVLGIIGRNGSGKSTLLKLISRITEPTTGRITVQGRVASLLEVGTGFHPELTGRENIYLNGAIMGMKRAEITASFDEIVGFAEVGQFLDTPVKRYSSGMYVRLAFAVAAHLKSEILIVDEVLAVGDADFQKRCLGKMHDVAQEDGRTVLFVSHNLNAVRRLCRAAILLDQGRVTHHGRDVEEALSLYQDSWSSSASNLVSNRDLTSTPRDKGNQIVVRSISLQNTQGASVSSFTPGEDLTLFATMDTADRQFGHLDISIFISNEQDERVATCLRADTEVEPLPVSGRFTCLCQISSLCFPSGTYWIGIGVSSYGQAIDKINHAIKFHMESAVVPRPGLLQLTARWRTDSSVLEDQ